MVKLQPNAMKNANILSFMTFWWMNDFFRKGSKRTLHEEDMYELVDNDTSEVVCEKLERNWKKELENTEKRKPSLTRAIIKTYYGYFLKLGFFISVEEGLRVVHPLMVAKLIKYFENISTTPVTTAYLYAGIISVISILLAIFHHMYFYNVQRLGWHLRAAACSLMYKKTLRLSQKALGQTTTGQIVNLGATDVIRFDFLPLFLHYIWIGPVQSIIIAYLLWDNVGPSVLSGISLLAMLMIIQSLNGRGFGRLRMMTATITDERIRLMNEVITGMRIIKMYTWEKPFAQLVNEFRKKEVRKILLTSMLRAFNLTMFITAAKLITCVTFIVFVATGGELTASKVFEVMGIYNVIRISMGLFFPLAVEKIAESLISIKRIETFLLLDEIDQNKDNQRVVNSDEKSFVEMKDFCGRWETADEDPEKKTTPTLNNLNIRVEGGQLLAVIGPVGSGKSSFLSAILGELPPSSGHININGQMTFANQVPWVFAGTVRENILFGEEYDAVWYEKVIHACGLERDLELLAEGDLTVVGERGVTLSGGQKARVNLARATYRKNANICLLDDPLSAVDGNVANHIFEHCISGIMKDKVRILVTHQLQLLKDVDEIIILKEGEVVGRGTYDELQADGTDFASLLQEREKEAEEDVVSSHFSDTDDEAKAFLTPLKSSKRVRSRYNSKMTASNLSLMSVGSQEIKSLLDDECGNRILEQAGEQISTEEPEELREQGSIGRSVYLEYFRVGANIFFSIVFGIMTVLSHLAFVLCDWWISIWATQYEKYVRSLTSLPNVTSSNETYALNTTDVMNATSLYPTEDPVSEFNTQYYLICYGVITLATFIIILIRAIMHFYVCVTSGIHMHNKMFKAILRAPIRFFDTNPSGRILNRFSKDIGQIDDLLPITFFDFLFIAGTIVTILIVAISINYLVAIITFPLIVYFFWLRQYYLKTSRDIKRMEGSTRSPVFSLLSSTLQGLSTVRAFRVEDEFIEKFHSRQDLHSSSWYLFLVGGRWLGVRLDLLSAFFITTVAILSVATLPIIPVSPGQVGLTLTYSIMLLGMFQWGVRQSAEVENLMTSVERVQQYYRIPPEAPEEIPEKKPSADWPKYGVVTFDKVSFAYYDGGPNVLTKIRVNVRAQEKVGIVGRTGAGKSSLISALFRLSELSDGEILIDGVSISSLGLNDLRGSLSIIPQDPILFTGTMRRNLDPFMQYSDDELWDALEQVQLKEVVQYLPLKLNTELAESGSNFSVGQRQLVCLARAILRNCKILVIDEATANVDLRTDRLIQLTIRDKFKQCTVLTIAHRINTIIDSDRVLVLDAGCVQEFDEPHTLLQNPDSSFTKMIDSIAGAEAEMLRKMAEEAHRARNESEIVMPEEFQDKDRSYLTRFLPTDGTYDALEIESGV